MRELQVCWNWDGDKAARFIQASGSFPVDYVVSCLPLVSMRRPAAHVCAVTSPKGCSGAEHQVSQGRSQCAAAFEDLGRLLLETITAKVRLTATLMCSSLKADGVEPLFPDVHWLFVLLVQGQEYPRPLLTLK